MTEVTETNLLHPVPHPHPHPLAAQRALRAIAVFEATKGLAALAGGIGLLGLLHHDLKHLALELIGHVGLNPKSGYPAVLLHYADVLHDANVRWLILGVLAYVALRLSEAWGLWRDRAWAQWLGAVSGAIYIPFEVHHFQHRPSLISALVLLGNVVIVLFLAGRVWLQRRAPAPHR